MAKDTDSTEEYLIAMGKQVKVSFTAPGLADAFRAFHRERFFYTLLFRSFLAGTLVGLPLGVFWLGNPIFSLLYAVVSLSIVTGLDTILVGRLEHGLERDLLSHLSDESFRQISLSDLDPD